jgi:peptide/nickel transport system permease protein
MRQFIARRIALALLTMLVVSFLVFTITRLHGDPRNLLYAADAIEFDQEQWDALGRTLGLDKPFAVQYAIFIGKLLRGDLGESIWRYKPVTEVLWGRIPATAQLALGGFIFSLLAIPLGVVSAVKRGSVWDIFARTIAVLGQSMPSFWVGIMLIFLFAVNLEWLPTSRRGDITHYVLPTITLGIFPLSGILRLVRSSMLDVMDSEFIKLARAKGAANARIVWKHAFRNALIAPLTFSGLLIAGLLTGSIITETVFAWPGLGLLAIGGVQNSDYPVTQGVVLVFTAFYVLASFAVDLAYAFIDPRIRLS